MWRTALEFRDRPRGTRSSRNLRNSRRVFEREHQLELQGLSRGGVEVGVAPVASPRDYSHGLRPFACRNWPCSRFNERSFLISQLTTERFGLLLAPPNQPILAGQHGLRRLMEQGAMRPFEAVHDFGQTRSLDGTQQGCARARHDELVQARIERDDAQGWGERPCASHPAGPAVRHPGTARPRARETTRRRCDRRGSPAPAKCGSRRPCAAACRPLPRSRTLSKRGRK